MNLVNGEILDAKACDAVLNDLEQRIEATLAKGRLDPEMVVAACGKLAAGIDNTKYLAVMTELGIDEALGRKYLDEARLLFGDDSLRRRLRIELGEEYGKAITIMPLMKKFSVTAKVVPLGALLHIAAGNADGLPVFSVLEGLLTGNVNILKLPAQEGGISVRLLLELIEAEPALAEYIYVFDYSSKDIVHIEKLIAVADAVVIWGGIEAVSALRRLVPVNVKLIEWGHKISFAYVTEQGITSDGLIGLARNIAETSQLLCSSLQGVFIDSDDMDQVYSFCERFLPILDMVMIENPGDVGIGLKNQVALRLYNEELEGIFKKSRVYKGEQCSLVAYPDKTLETAIQFGNAWVRPLPRDEILARLRPYKNYLQTVGLLCAASERDSISEILVKTGVVRICSGENMSQTYCGEPHDGEYALRRYTKIVHIENG